MRRWSSLKVIITLTALLSMAGCGGSSGSGTVDNQTENLKTVVERGIQKLYDDWSVSRMDKDVSALTGSFSTDYLNDGLTYANRVAAISGSIDDLDFSSYNLTLENLDSYGKSSATATGHYVYNFRWVPADCDVARDFSSQGHFGSNDNGLTWQSRGNQSSAFRTPELADIVTSTVYSSNACLIFTERASDQKTAFYPADPKVYALAHFNNLLGNFTGWREWVKPNGKVYSRTNIDINISSDSYSGVTVGGSLGIVGYGNFWSANQGEWTFRGEITGSTGTVSFSTKFTFSHRVPSRIGATIADTEDRPEQRDISTVSPPAL